ncbi:MAG: excinuclease ABC subunit A, partial [Pseudohongiellaceae bacterium]
RKAAPRQGRGLVTLRGATLHNLQHAQIAVGLGTFHVLVGASGAGKSSLLFGTLLPALQGLPGGAFDALEGAPAGGVQAVDARPIGRTPRSTPATWSGLFDVVRKRFAAEPLARELGFGPGRFSYNNKEGRCAACEGLGFQRVGLHLLEDLELICPVCAGGRYAAETLAVTLRGSTVADVLAMTVSEARQLFADDPPLHEMFQAMEDLGLGYLCLGHSANKLSRGEGQRVKLATLLGQQSAEPSFVLLDEPDRGLHPNDVQLLLAAIDALVDKGHTVVAISHHRHVWAAADAVTELLDGHAQLANDLELAPLSNNRGQRAAAALPPCIRLEGVSTHNLAAIDVEIPHEKLTVIAGVSGSGKSSLAYGTLAAEAWRRYAESLPFQVRRFMRRMPRAQLSGASGLGPTLSLRPGQARAGSRSTVATQSELGPILRLLWSRAGTVNGQPCGFTAGHFSTEQPLGACLPCEGRGVIARCDRSRLVSHPERALADGAMGGSRPGKFFTERGGQYLATLQAALQENVGETVDLSRPWSELAPEVQAIALQGTGDTEYAVRWSYQRGQRAGEHRFEGPWQGFLHLVEREAQRRAGSKAAAEWRAPLTDVACLRCAGAGLRQEIAEVVVGGLDSQLTLQTLLSLPLRDVTDALGQAQLNSPHAAILGALLPGLSARLDDLLALGLGHLSLGRQSSTLSDGELQRTRLASVIRAGLSGVTVVLDEPGTGLHSKDVAGLLTLLRQLVRDGNTVVVVSHRPEVLRGADHMIELGPGPGADGGRVVGCGAPGQLLAGDGPTARAFRRAAALQRNPSSPWQRAERIEVFGACANNLQHIDVALPASGFVCVSGVSGSGKSSLIFDVIESSARAGAPVHCTTLRRVGDAGASVSWALDGFKNVVSSRRPSGSHTVLSAMGLLAPMQTLFFAASHDKGLRKASFSFLSPAGRCEVCKGSGRESIAMDFQADLALTCPGCGGGRYGPEVLDVLWSEMNVVAFLARPIAELRELMPPGKLSAGLQALVDVGLGYLHLGRRSAELSAGERQRVSLAAGLAGSLSPTLYLLDEPATGLHESDLVRLVEVFRKLTAQGDLIVAAEHRTSLIAAADCEIELGPGSAAAGGRVVSPTR